MKWMPVRTRQSGAVDPVAIGEYNIRRDDGLAKEWFHARRRQLHPLETGNQRGVESGVPEVAEQNFGAGQ
jgi:hypothetical protein